MDNTDTAAKYPLLISAGGNHAMTATQLIQVGGRVEYTAAVASIRLLPATVQLDIAVGVLLMFVHGSYW